MLDQEKCRLEHEKFRVQTLLQGMQDAMTAYNAGGSATTLLPSVISSAAMTSTTMISSPAVYPVYNTPAMMPASRPSNTQMDPSKFSTSITNQLALKRKKGSKEYLDVPVMAKRTRSHSTTNQLAAKGTNTLSQSTNAINNQENASPYCNVLDGSPVQGSSVTKCLFDQPSRSPPTNLPVPKTPLRATSSQTNKSTSPLEESSTATSGNEVTPQQKISTNCIVISSETIRVSPAKQLTYLSVERNHCISASSPVKTNLKRHNKRDHVKGRLDFDGSGAITNSGQPNPDGITVSESDKTEDIFDLDLSTLDVLGADFSLSELLVDFNFDEEFSCQSNMGPILNSHSGSPDEPWNIDSGAHQVLSELSSTVTEFFSEKDMNVQGPESATSMKSTTKCIKILSPVKNYSSCSDQEKLSARS